MRRSFGMLAGAVLALAACSGKAAYQPPVDPMLPGDGYGHARATSDCPPSVTAAQCAVLHARQAEHSR
jgi:hypothetical protein